MSDLTPNPGWLRLQESLGAERLASTLRKMRDERDYLEELRSNLCDYASEVTLAYNTRDSDRLEAAIFHLDVERLTAVSCREEAMDGDQLEG